MDGKYPRFSWLCNFSGRLRSRLAGLPEHGGIQAGVLAMVAGALLFTRLSCPLLEPEETRYAEIPRQMLAEGRFLEPVWHGEPYYHKPPLLYWLVMASYRIFGVHDWAARLVPVLASFATVFVIWLWGRRVAGTRVGFAAALVLILSGRFVYLGRMLTMDGLLTLWVTTALAAAHLAICEKRLRRCWWMLSAFATGLGLLTKGPVALVLTLVPIILFHIPVCLQRPRQTGMFTPRALPLRALAVYLGLAVALAAPWYIAMAVMNPEAAGDFFWLHHVQRFLDPLDHEEPWWFFLPGLVYGTLPWSLLLVPLSTWLIRRRATFPPGLHFALLSAAWCVLFFSLSGCKRAVYILPALPWLAMCLGYCLVARPWQVWRWLAAPRLWKIVGVATFAILFIGVHEWLPSYHRRFALRGQVRRHVDVAADVYCYPKRWDGVSFYLERDDVRVFSTEERAELIAALQARPGALLFAKTRMLNELLDDLPPSVNLIAVGRQSERLTVWRAEQRKLPGDGVANVSSRRIE